MSIGHEKLDGYQVREGAVTYGKGAAELDPDIDIDLDEQKPRPSAGGDWKSAPRRETLCLMTCEGLLVYSFFSFDY